MRTDRLAGRKDTRRDSRLEACDHHVDRGLRDQMVREAPGLRPEVERLVRRSLHRSLLASCEVAVACSGIHPLSLPRSHPTELELMSPLQGRTLAGQIR